VRRTRATALLAVTATLGLLLGLGVGDADPAAADTGPYEVVGRVVDADGDPVENAPVSINSANPGPGTSQYGTGTTDENGEFTVEGFSTDTLTVSVAAFDPDWPYFPERMNVLVGPSNPSARADLTLRALPANDATITGTITVAGTSTPIENASITASYQVGADFLSRSAKSGPDGGYVLTLPSSSTTFRTISINGPSMFESGYTGVTYTTKQIAVKALPGSTTRNVQLVPEPVGDHSVSGSVVLSGGATFTSGFASIQTWPYGTTDNASIDPSTGEFSFEGLLAGTYRLSLGATGAQNRDLRVVVDGDEDLGEIELTAFETGTGSVSGSLTDLRTGEPLVGASVSLFPYTGVLAAAGFVTTEGDGSWSFADLPDGRYGLSASTYGMVPPAGSIGYREYSLFQEVVVDDGGATTGVALGLTSVVPGTSVLEGRARDAVTHLPIAGARVVVAFPSPSLEAVEAVTDAQGRFTIPNLIEGPASVGVIADGYLEKSVTVDIQGASTAVVVPVQRSTAPVSTFRDGTLTATVLGLDDEPLDDAKVIVTSFDLSSDYWFSYTDGDGVSEVTDLTDGVWKVYAEDIYYNASGRVFEVAQIELTSDDRNASVTLHQVVPGTITGRVDLGEFSAQGLYVTLFDARGIFLNQAEVEADGNYVMSNVTPGDYRLQLGPSPVTSGSYVEGSGGRDEIGASTVWWTGVPDGDGHEQSPNADDAALIEIAEGETLTGHDFVAVAGATVRTGAKLQTAAGVVDLPAGRCFTLTAYRQIGSAWVLDPAGGDVACGTEPLVARGLAGGQYKFAVTDEYSGSTAFRTVYNGGASSLAAASPVTLVAGESVDLGTLTVSIPRPEDATLEAIDLDSLEDLELYEDQIGLGGAEPQAGEPADVEVGQEFAGQWVNVTLNSDPVVVGATWHQVSAAGTVSVVLPSSLDGDHRLAVGDSNGQLVGWTGVTIEPAAPETPGGTAAPKPATKPRGTSGTVATPSSSPTPTPTPTPVATEEPVAEPTAEPEPTASDDSAGDGGWIVWLIVGALVVVVGAAAVLIFRRRLA